MWVDLELRCIDGSLLLIPRLQPLAEAVDAFAHKVSHLEGSADLETMPVPTMRSMQRQVQHRVSLASLRRSEEHEDGGTGVQRYPRPQALNSRAPGELDQTPQADALLMVNWTKELEGAGLPAVAVAILHTLRRLTRRETGFVTLGSSGGGGDGMCAITSNEEGPRTPSPLSPAVIAEVLDLSERPVRVLC